MDKKNNFKLMTDVRAASVLLGIRAKFFIFVRHDNIHISKVGDPGNIRIETDNYNPAIKFMQENS